MSNNNNYDHEEGALKIDEDIDPGKENRMDSPISNDDDIAELDVSNGGSSDEEEEAMPGPGVELADPPSKFKVKARPINTCVERGFNVFLSYFCYCKYHDCLC